MPAPTMLEFADWLVDRNIIGQGLMPQEKIRAAEHVKETALWYWDTFTASTVTPGITITQPGVTTQAVPKVYTAPPTTPSAGELARAAGRTAWPLVPSLPGMETRTVPPWLAPTPVTTATPPVTPTTPGVGPPNEPPLTPSTLTPPAKGLKYNPEAVIGEIAGSPSKNPTALKNTLALLTGHLENLVVQGALAVDKQGNLVNEALNTQYWQTFSAINDVSNAMESATEGPTALSQYESAQIANWQRQLDQQMEIAKMEETGRQERAVITEAGTKERAIMTERGMLERELATLQLSAAKSAIPPGMTHLPGFEPGGRASTWNQSLGGQGVPPIPIQGTPVNFSNITNALAALGGGQ